MNFARFRSWVLYKICCDQFKSIKHTLKHRTCSLFNNRLIYLVCKQAFRYF